MERMTAAPWGRNIKGAGPLAASFLIGLVLGPMAVSAMMSSPTPPAEQPPAPPPAPTLTHAQEVWLGALEWCESRGVETAVNPKDRDGTPSYYSFQFKPGTFEGFAKQYGVPGKISDYAAQRAIVVNMILDTSITPHDWRYQQFPDCVRILGQHP